MLHTRTRVLPWLHNADKITATTS